ncbi:MAG: DoxX family protein [Candidatus Nanopelagicales bacterium]|nr:DoxX family protein [Candidatus Nanopelagicales bacterium]
MALIILAALLGLMTAFSAFGKFSMNEKAVEMLVHVGLRERQIRLLGTVEILGALGLLVGIWIPLLGQLAALGFVLYFAGAVIAHIRVRDGVKDMGPAILLTVLSIIVTVLQFSR